MSKMMRHPGTEYRYIAKLTEAFKSGSCMARVVLEPGGPMHELKVVFIHAQNIVVSAPPTLTQNDHSRQMHVITYEDVEYPRYSIACRSIAAIEGQQLHPISEKAKRDKDKLAAWEELQQAYVDDHWRDHYETARADMEAFYARQRMTPEEVREQTYAMFVRRVGELATQLRDMGTHTQSLTLVLARLAVQFQTVNEGALKEAMLRQCAVTFWGEDAVCICKEKGNMGPCKFAMERLRQVLETYLSTT